MTVFDPQLFVQDKSILPLVDESDRPAIVSALEVAFLASLHTNEGRPLEFVLAVVPDSRNFANASKLTSPEPLIPETLKFLSAGLDPEYRCFVVAPEDDRLKIHAISPRPYPSRLPGEQLPPLVVVDGPGRVALTINDKRILYDRGELRREDEDPLRRWVDESAGIIVAYVSTPTRSGQGLPVGINAAFRYDPARWKSHEDAFRRHAGDYAPTLLAGVLRLTAKWIKGARHGGALLLLPGNANLQDITSGGRWFRDGDKDLQHSVLKAASLRSHLALALVDGAWVLDELGDEYQKDIKRWAREVINPRFNEALLNLDSACQRCARLTQVDGTTILGSDLRVLGFGARLKAARPKNLPTSCEDFLKSRGNRHSSMAYTVACIDNALGLVVSQDGNAVAFHKPVGGGMCHRELIL